MKTEGLTNEAVDFEKKNAKLNANEKERSQPAREKIICFLMNFYLEAKNKQKSRCAATANPSTLLENYMIKFYGDGNEKAPSIRSIRDA
jgi:hypothetical protein